MTMTTADPRTLDPGAGAWLTNSRVYNLIWLGRWMERAESLVRAVDAAALAAAESGAPVRPALSAAAEAWGVSVPDGEPPLPAIRAALRASIERARDNAHQIAPLEFIQRVNALLESVESESDANEDVASAGAAGESDENESEGAANAGASAADESPQALRDFAAQTLDAVAEASGVIERTWFNRQGLTNEELMQRFAQ